MKSLPIITFIIVTLCLPVIGQSDWPSIPDANLYTGNYRQAVEDFSEYIDRNPNNPIAYIQRAKAYGMLGEFTSKENDILKAIQLNPVKTHLILSKGNRTSAVAKKAFDYSQKDGSFTKSPVRIQDYSLSLDELDNLSMSIVRNILKSAISYDLGSVELLIDQQKFSDIPDYLRSDMVGLYYLKSGELDEATHYFEQSTQQNPKYALAYHNLAIAHYLSGDVEAALEEIQIALELKEDLPLLHYTKASFIEMSNPKLALDYYQKAIALDDNYTEAKVNYSSLLKSDGNYDDSLVYLSSSLDNVDQLTERKFIEGTLSLVDGDYTAAISSYNEYLTFEPEDPDGLFNRGLSYLLLSNYNEGCSDIDASLTLKNDLERSEIFNQLCLSTPILWEK